MGYSFSYSSMKFYLTDNLNYNMKVFSCTLFVSIYIGITTSQASFLDKSDSSENPVEDYIRLLNPNEQHTDGVKLEAKRSIFLRNSDLMITKLLGKLDRMKFIVNKRLQDMRTNLARKLKGKGLTPIAKYHRIYHYLSNPLVNPYTHLNVMNRLSMPPQMQNDPSFQSFQNNISQFADTYANSIANLKSGLFDSDNELRPLIDN